MTPAVRDIILSNRVAWSFMGDGSRVWDFTRASDGMRVNPAGSWETIGTNGLRYDYDPTTGSLRGLLIEPARENGVRNNTMVGAAVGTPGTLPTNWAASLPGGLSYAVQALGTTAIGEEYIDIRVSGTTVGTNLIFRFDTLTQIVAASGQAWSNSISVGLRAGSLTGITWIYPAMLTHTAAGVYVSVLYGSDIAPSLTFEAKRFSFSGTLAGGASVERVVPAIQPIFSSGGTLDFTLRIAWSQAELGGFATSPIRTAGAAVTRAVDALSLAVPSGTYSVDVIGGSVLLAGTRYTDTVTVTGTSWSFAWPTAAVTAGERHLQRVSMRRIG